MKTADAHPAPLRAVIRAEFISDAPREVPLTIQRPKKMPVPPLFSLETSFEILCATAAERTGATPLETRPPRAEAFFFTQGTNMSKHNKGRNMSEKNQSTARATRELKVAEFNFDAPEAQSVKLAADFTEWEKRPLEMNKTPNGHWHLNVPLSPGDYCYRFIVDGEWRDDPRPARQVFNPFGTTNAVLKVS